MLNIKVTPTLTAFKVVVFFFTILLAVCTVNRDLSSRPNASLVRVNQVKFWQYCSNCDHRVSHDARACPNCGVGFDGAAPIMTPKKGLTMVLVGVAIFVGLLGVSALGAFVTLQRNQSQNKAVDAQQRNRRNPRKEMVSRSLNSGSGNAGQRWGVVQTPQDFSPQNQQSGKQHGFAQLPRTPQQQRYAQQTNQHMPTRPHGGQRPQDPPAGPPQVPRMGS